MKQSVRWSFRFHMFFFLLFVGLSCGWTQEADEQYADAVEQVRSALSGMNALAATAALETAKPLAQTDEQKQELKRLEAIVPLIDSYVKWISQISASCQLSEIKLSDTSFVSVVEMTASEVTVRAEGKNKTYSINQLPPKLVRIMVQGIYNKTPDNKAIYGAYEGFHPKGDRELARQLWEQAAKAGLNTGSLIPELDVPRVPPLILLPGQENRMAIPSKEETESGLDSVLKKYSKQIEKAKTDPMKEKLAFVLLKPATKDKKMTAAERFALLNYIEQLGRDLSKPAIACEALAAKSQFYQINTVRKRIKLILTAEGQTKQENAQLAQVSGSLLQECGLTNRWDDARTLIPLVKKFAAEGGAGAMIKLANQAEAYLEKSQK